ncbi:MAG: family 43 glycosylhydrolase [Puia sp.]
MERTSCTLSPSDFTWAKADAFASRVVFHNQKFYWYVAVSHATISGKAIGVAVSDQPWGPFYDAKGSAMITQDMIPDKQMMMVNLDPTVFIDDEGRGHIFWGNSKCYYAKLKANMIDWMVRLKLSRCQVLPREPISINETPGIIFLTDSNSLKKLLTR